jgi:hypothetical protein
MIEIPSGRRSSDPVPMLSTIGSAPNIARHRGHQDRPQTEQRRCPNRLLRRQAFATLGIERHVDHHDRVLLDDADEQDQSDQRDDRELGRSPSSASMRRRLQMAAWRESSADESGSRKDAEHDVAPRRARRRSTTARWRAIPGRRARFPGTIPEGCRHADVARGAVHSRQPRLPATRRTQIERQCAAGNCD